MNTTKITLLEFRQLKEKLRRMASRISDEISRSYNITPDEEERMTKRFIDEYSSLQNELLAYDLSDIPFEEWSGIHILSGDGLPVDFSKTRANIDFGLIEYNGNGNFKGCNIKNLDVVFPTYLDANGFDTETILQYPSLFLVGKFTEDFKRKFYSNNLVIDDLVGLNSEQLTEIGKKDYLKRVFYENHYQFFNGAIELDKLMDLYVNHKVVYDGFLSLFNSILHYHNLDKLKQKLTQVPATDIKKVFYEFTRNCIINSECQIVIDDNMEVFNPRSLIVSTLPKDFVNENKDIFLIDVDIPIEVKYRFSNRDLSLTDYYNYFEVFKDIPYLSFSRDSSMFKYTSKCGTDNINYAIKKYPHLFLMLENTGGLWDFSECLVTGLEIDENIKQAAVKYLYEYDTIGSYLHSDGEKVSYDTPAWLSNLGFSLVHQIRTIEELLNYKDTYILDNRKQKRFIDELNIKNIKRLEEETNIFSHFQNKPFESFTGFYVYYTSLNEKDLRKHGIDFREGTLPYPLFRKQFALFLNLMRKNNIFTDIQNYDWIKGDFRNDFPEFFISEEAPEELKVLFYKNMISLDIISQHKEYIPFLVDKDIRSILPRNVVSKITAAFDRKGNYLEDSVSFIDEYIKRYGNLKFLNLIAKYGNLLTAISIYSYHDVIEDEHKIEQFIEENVYKFIKEMNLDYEILINNDDFRTKHPDLFIDLDRLEIPIKEKERLTDAFYKRILSFHDIRLYPELIDVLKDKYLAKSFTWDFGSKNFLQNNRSILNNDLKLIDYFGNENFLILCSLYGRYLYGISNSLPKFNSYVDSNKNSLPVSDIYNSLNFEDLKSLIEKIIVDKCKNGELAYVPTDVPEFLKTDYPELFLDDNAPMLLQYYFYNYGNNYPLSFVNLKKNKDWIPYLEGKDIKGALLRGYKRHPELKKYFELFGDKALSLVINKAETVDEMIKSYQVDLMKLWYDKTGGKFIPDYVVMQNLEISDIDKFLAAGSNWSRLMKIKNYSENPDGRDALLKLAYAFGVFDLDQRGYKQLFELLTGLPRTVPEQYDYIFDSIDAEIDIYTQRGYFYKEKAFISVDENGNEYTKYIQADLTDEEYENAYKMMIEHLKEINFKNVLDSSLVIELFETIRAEKVNVDFRKCVFAQLYRKSDNGSFVLTINPQKYPKTADLLRNILNKFNDFPILTAEKAHRYIGGFKLYYDSQFKDFFLKNFNEIINSSEYLSSIANVQRRFQEISAIYCNVPLTLDLAYSYIGDNRYENVNTGNELVTTVAAMNKYEQQDFETLQKIYNFAKQRTFSSIPRIEGTKDKYYYEILRLDDPLAMAIGYLTNCCQRLHEPGRQCMEHSMVDNNGRLFVIKDANNHDIIIAQSWVWRNGDVLCFDNIEVPDQQMWDHGIPHGKEDNGIRNEFTDEILEIYKQAAKELMAEDERIYKELLDSGKITQEEFDSLRLGKITTGVGYSNISGSFETLKRDREIARPLDFQPPVDIGGSYYTNDSTSQYILEERDNRSKYRGEPLKLHNDTYTEYTDDNFNERMLLILQKLEIVTKENTGDFNTTSIVFDNKEQIVSKIADYYFLNPENTRIVMNPNFAIIYEIDGDTLKIADLFYNFKIDNGAQQFDIENKVLIQIKLALEQIGKDKNIDISDLSYEQKEIYKKVAKLSEEIDIERGFSNGK